MTTIGYGDFYPITSGGRMLVALLMLTGVRLLGSTAASLVLMFPMSPSRQRIPIDAAVRGVRKRGFLKRRLGQSRASAELSWGLTLKRRTSWKILITRKIRALRKIPIIGITDRGSIQPHRRYEMPFRFSLRMKSSRNAGHKRRSTLPRITRFLSFH